MLRKLIALSLLLGIGLSQGSAFANNYSSGPGDSKLCRPGSVWDPYEEACVSR